jgi:single-strand DNA-binding protein
MPSLNKVILVGRLTRDPEMRYTSSGLAVTTFSLAVDRRYKTQSGEKQTDFFRCKAWRQKAEFVANYVTKGRLVAVEGSIETSEVVGQDGQKKYFTDIVCDNIELLESNREHGEGGAAGGAAAAPAGHDDYSPEYSGGSAAATPAANAGAGNTAGGNGYFPDDDMGAAPSTPRGNMNRPSQAVPRSANPNAGVPQQRGGAGVPQRPAQTTNRPAPAAQPAYPQDDFDDSDPFADE